MSSSSSVAVKKPRKTVARAGNLKSITVWNHYLRIKRLRVDAMLKGELKPGDNTKWNYTEAVWERTWTKMAKSVKSRSN
jgi:hypothetical protein